MKIDEAHFRALLAQAIDENTLCCRAVLSLCRVEFTPDVPTLAVSLGKRSTLQVNLDFIRAHCETEEHVQAVLLHEFLHILLGHTVRIPRATPALNIALDAVINSIIHRTCGDSYSSMMARYYANAQGPLRLLRPMTPAESKRCHSSDPETCSDESARKEADLLRVHSAILNGFMTSNDILDIVQHFSAERLEGLLRNGPLLLGGHGNWGDPLESLPPERRDMVRQALSVLDGYKIWGGRNPIASELSAQHVQSITAPPGWIASTRKILRRLLVPDPRSSPPNSSRPLLCKLPVLNSSDRRGALRTLWNPLLPELEWALENPLRQGTVQVYLDVSGSMHSCLPFLVALLGEFSPWIRLPLWAFSTTVVPATIRNGRLVTETSGGTAVACVIKHAKRSGARKALIVTDGFVEGPPRSFTLPCPIEAIIPHDGADHILAAYGIPVTQLPPA
jgi:hypothetical protein